MCKKKLFQIFVLFADLECLFIGRFVLTKSYDLGLDVFDVLLFPLPMIPILILDRQPNDIP